MAESEKNQVSAPDQIAGEQVVTPESQQARLNVKIDERKLESTYANAFRTYATAEEIVVDYGMQLLTRQPQAGEAAQPGELVFSPESRVILSYPTAKRLAMTLSQTIRNYEQRVAAARQQAADQG